MRRIAAVTVAAVLPVAALAGCGLSGGHGSSAASAGVVTRAVAQQVLSRYITLDNRSGKLREDSLLATFEGGSSYQIDAGIYRWTLSSDPSNKDYSAVDYVDPQFFIPWQSGYPAWFAVRALEEDGPSLTDKAQAYLVFTKASASAPWLEVREPGAYGLPAEPQPQIATASGYATQVSPSDSTGLALAPDKLPAQDVAYLDVDNIPTTAPRPGLPVPKRPKVINFVNGKTTLVEFADTSDFQSQLQPAGGSVTDTHQTTGDQIYALRAVSGGVLVFYDLTASVSMNAPYGEPFSITVPGFFTNDRQSTEFTLNVIDQFAVYEPPGKSVSPEVLANNSAMVSGDCDGVLCT
jgi:hypothetical protein